MGIVEKVVAWLAQQPIEAYLVGGCVRDLLLNRPIHDLDVVVASGGLGWARRLADRFRGTYFALDEERGTGRVILDSGAGRLLVDFSQFRGSDLAADLADRDFTINALAADTHTPDQVIDQHRGLADLQTRTIRPVSDLSIRNDPVRALRAVRQAADLSFTLAPETETLIRRDGAALNLVSSERIRDELARLLSRADSAPHLERLDDLGLLTIVLPELEPLRGMAQPPPHHLDALSHSFETIGALEVLLESWSGAERTREQQEGIIPLRFATGTIERQQPLPDTLHPISRTSLSALLPFAERLQAHLERTLGDVRPALVVLKLAALLHDVGKPAVRTIDCDSPRSAAEPDDSWLRFIGHDKRGAAIAGGILRRLRFNNAEVRLGEGIILHHMRPLLLDDQEDVTRRAIYRFFRDTREFGVEVLLLALADYRATVVDDSPCSSQERAGRQDDGWSRLLALVARMMGDYWERSAERVAPPPLLDGNDLLREFGLEPGPRIGDLLDSVREAQAIGEVHTREDALALVEHRLLESRN